MNPLELFGGSGGFSGSSSATSGDAKSGNLGQSFSFGGINTGTQSDGTITLLIVAAVVVLFLLKRR